MDTSALMASEEATGGEIEKKVSGLENPGQSGRRKPKSNEGQAQKKKKKLPQRGMGVAQLERLRTQKTPLQSPIDLHSHYFLPTPYPDPTTAIAGAYGRLDLNQALLLQRLGNGGLRENGLMVSDQYRVDPYQFVELNPGGFRGGDYVGETSKELSSIPNPIRYPADQCGICHKKKRMNGGSFGCNGTREKYSGSSLINGCNFLGLNVGNVNQGSSGALRKRKLYFKLCLPIFIFYMSFFLFFILSPDFQSLEDLLCSKTPSSNLAKHDSGVEMVGGAHRKGNSSGAMMEYEFFPPGKGGRGTFTKELDLSLFSEASVAVVGDGVDHQGSCVTTTTSSISTGFDASTSVDLSLKLSY